MRFDPPHSPRFEALDSLRGLCALMVALFHFRANSHVEDLNIIRNAWLFVDFFFVLSGFVIAASYGHRMARREVGIRTFLALRLARLYPLHLFMLALFVAFEAAMALLQPALGDAGREFFAGARSPTLLPENLLLLHSLGLSGVESWNVPSWSISAEFWTYALFALLMAIGATGRRLFWFLGLAVCPLVILIAHGGRMSLEADGGILRCLAGFAAGAALWSFRERFKTFRPSAGLEFPAVLLVLTFVTTAPGLGLTLLAPLVFAVAIWVFAAERGVISPLLRWRWFVLLGALSYSIYMTHTFVHARLKNIAIILQNKTEVSLFQDAAFRFFGPDRWMGDAFVLACVVVTLAFSILTYHLIERPGQALGRTWVSRQRAVA